MPDPELLHTQKPDVHFLSHENVNALDRFIDTLLLKAYSASTIKTYRNEFYQLLKELKHIHVDRLDAELVRRYMLHCIAKQNLSEATVNSRINVLEKI